MTMQHESHPHDERLAALAGADPQATNDRALRDHVAACDRCRAVVDDIALLRSALAELPDLQPSRPLQLLPPVAAPAAPRGGVLGVLRRLSAPALAAGAGLILVGAVGSTGIINSLGGMAASAPLFQNVGENLSGGSDAAASAVSAAASAAAAEPSQSRTSAEGSLDSGGSPVPAAESPGFAFGPAGGAPSGSAAPTREDDHEIVLGARSDPLDERLPWLVLLGIGVVLAAGSLLLRFTVQPGAG